MSIIPFSLEDFVDGFYLDLNDVIQVKDRNGGSFNAVILNYETSSRIKSSISADAQSGSVTNYNLAGSNKQSIRDVKLAVDHNTQQITALASEVTENTEKISEYLGMASNGEDYGSTYRAGNSEWLVGSSGTEMTTSKARH